MAWNLVNEYGVELNIKNNVYIIGLDLGNKRHETLRLKNAAEFNAVLTVLEARSHILFNDEDKTFKSAYKSVLPLPHSPSNAYIDSIESA